VGVVGVGYVLARGVLLAFLTGACPRPGWGGGVGVGGVARARLPPLPLAVAGPLLLAGDGGVGGDGGLGVLVRSGRRVPLLWGAGRCAGSGRGSRSACALVVAVFEFART
jgi:hypothetical protein